MRRAASWNGARGVWKRRHRQPDEKQLQQAAPASMMPLQSRETKKVQEINMGRRPAEKSWSTGCFKWIKLTDAGKILTLQKKSIWFTFRRTSQNMGIDTPCLLRCRRGVGDTVAYSWVVILRLLRSRDTRRLLGELASRIFIWLVVLCFVSSTPPGKEVEISNRGLSCPHYQVHYTTLCHWPKFGQGKCLRASWPIH